jgi:hypothetical protein
MSTRDAFVGGDRSSSDELEGGDVVVGGRGFLGFELWGSSVRGGGPAAFVTVLVLEVWAQDALSEALVGTVNPSSVKLSSLHSRSGSPFGWVRVRRKWEKAAHSTYFFWRHILISDTVPVCLSLS